MNISRTIVPLLVLFGCLPAAALAQAHPEPVGEAEAWTSGRLAVRLGIGPGRLDAEAIRSVWLPRAQPLAVAGNVDDPGSIINWRANSAAASAPRITRQAPAPWPWGWTLRGFVGGLLGGPIGTGIVFHMAGEESASGEALQEPGNLRRKEAVFVGGMVGTGIFIYALFRIIDPDGEAGVKLPEGGTDEGGETF